MSVEDTVERAKALGLTLGPRSYPIARARLSFPLYWSLKGRQVWAPLRFDQSGFFYGETSELDAFLTRLCGKAQKESQYFEVGYYAFTPMARVPRRRYFHAHRILVSFEVFLDELLAIRAAARELSGKQPGVELNRKVSMVLLHLGPQELSELSDPRIRAKLLSLLDDAGMDRFHFFIVAQDARMVPTVILNRLDWKAYLGEDNFTYAHSFHEDLPEEPYNVNRKLSGMLVDSALQLRLPIHDLAYEVSGYKKANDYVDMAEEDAYRRLLDTI